MPNTFLSYRRNIPSLSAMWALLWAGPSISPMLLFRDSFTSSSVISKVWKHDAWGENSVCTKVNERQHEGWDKQQQPTRPLKRTSEQIWPTMTRATQAKWMKKHTQRRHASAIDFWGFAALKYSNQQSWLSNLSVTVAVAYSREC